MKEYSVSKSPAVKTDALQKDEACSLGLSTPITNEEHVELSKMLQFCLQEATADDFANLGSLEQILSAPRSVEIQGKRLMMFAFKTQQRFCNDPAQRVLAIQSETIQEYMRTHKITYQQLRVKSNSKF
jgi:hypothetical protein